MSFRLSTHGTASGFQQAVLGRVTIPGAPVESRPDHVLVLGCQTAVVDLEGYAGLLSSSTTPDPLVERALATHLPLVHDARQVDHLENGDIVSLEPSGYVRTLYRASSDHNAIFATDRCNSFCLMCSQPPKAVDDRDRIGTHLRLIELMDPAPRELGITGGEPSLLKDDLLRLISHCKHLLSGTALHVLSNGRLFYYGAFARKLGSIGHPDLMVGVPVYSDIPSVHDFVVQSRGAFEQTMIGLQNLGRYGVPVEIRVVLHRHTVGRLAQLAELIYRNLTFASHVTFMGLELMGFAVANLQDLWVDPYDYREELRAAVFHLAARGMNVSIYNHQLCLVPRDLWTFCRQSISDWKNDYMPCCDGCAVRGSCGGFFTSSLKRRVSDYLAPVADVAPTRATEGSATDIL